MGPGNEATSEVGHLQPKTGALGEQQLPTHYFESNISDTVLVNSRGFHLRYCSCAHTLVRALSRILGKAWRGELYNMLLREVWGHAPQEK